MPAGSKSHAFLFSWAAGEQERDVQVSKEDAKAVITDFDNSKEYSFKVYTVSGSQLSKPLLGTYKGNLSARTISKINFAVYALCMLHYDRNDSNSRVKWS